MTKLMGAFLDNANTTKINFILHREHCVHYKGKLDREHSIPYKGKSVNTVQSLFVLMILEIT